MLPNSRAGRILKQEEPIMSLLLAHSPRHKPQHWLIGLLLGLEDLWPVPIIEPCVIDTEVGAFKAN